MKIEWCLPNANFKDLLDKVFVLNPDKRITVTEALVIYLSQASELEAVILSDNSPEAILPCINSFSSSLWTTNTFSRNSS